MATYAYQQNYYDGASAGYVKYNISPDFGTPIAPGEVVTVTGIAYCSSQANTVLEVVLCNGTTYTAKHKNACSLNIKIPKGKATSFTATFEMPVLKDDIFGTDRLRYAWICFGLMKEDGDGGYSGSETVAVDTQKVSYLAYRINPKIIGADFVRCALEGEIYKENDEGTKAFGSLSISLADGYTASDITIAKAVVTPQGGTATTISISQSILAAALTADGYSEITDGTVTITADAGMLYSFDFDTAYNYDITVTIGDTYDTYSCDFDIARAFANLHLSGAKNGGACFGGFCKSTDDNPMLESYYPLYAYSGVVEQYSTDETVVGIWIDGKKIYRKILQWTSALTNGKSNYQYINPKKPDGTDGTIETFVNVWGMAWKAGYIWKLPYYDDSSSHGITLEIETNSGNPRINILPGGSRGALGAFAVVEFTLTD